MIFNPLFIDTETKQMNVFGSGKSQNSYLFRDIINIEKNLGEERKFFSSSVLTNLMNDVKGLFKNNTDQFSLSNEIESLLLSSSNFGEIENDLQELKDSQANENSIIVNNTIDNIVDFLKSTLDNLNDNFDVEIITENSEQMNYPGDLSYGDTLETIAAKLLNNEPILLSVENNNTSQFFELSLEKINPGIISLSNENNRETYYKISLKPIEEKVDIKPSGTNSSDQILLSKADFHHSGSTINNPETHHSTPSDKYKTADIPERKGIIQVNITENIKSNQKVNNEIVTGELKETIKNTINNDSELITTDKTNVDNHTKIKLSDNHLSMETEKKPSENNLSDVLKTMPSSNEDESKLVDKLLRKSLIESFEKKEHHSLDSKTVEQKPSHNLVTNNKHDLKIESKQISNNILIELKPKSANSKDIYSESQQTAMRELNTIARIRKNEFESLHKNILSKLPETISTAVNPLKQKQNAQSKISNSPAKLESNASEKETAINKHEFETQKIKTPHPEQLEKTYSELSDENYSKSSNKNASPEQQNDKNTIKQPNKSINYDKNVQPIENEQNDPEIKQSKYIDRKQFPIKQNETEPASIPNEKDTTGKGKQFPEVEKSESKIPHSHNDVNRQNTANTDNNTQHVIHQKDINPQRQMFETQVVKVNPQVKEQPKLNSKLVDEINELIISDKKDQAIINLEPAALGKIKIALEIIENKVNARLEVENQAAKEMLQNQVEFLRENINTGGIQLSSISISLQNNDQKNHKANREKRKENNITKNEVSENKGKETNIKSLGYNTYEFLA
jgi:flagellar hook-length control protein FliK